MKITLAVTDPVLVYRYAEAVGDRSLGPVSLLVSLPYADGTIPVISSLKSDGLVDFVMFDAGTYTLNQGGRFTGFNDRFDEYMDFILAHGEMADIIAAYDLDFKAPRLNQQFYNRMLLRLGDSALVSKIIPVVHSADSAAAEFKYYLDCGARYVGIGSKPRIPNEEWLKIKRLRFWHDVWMHIFGTLELSYIKDTIPDSVDSARYARDVEFGRFFYWDDDAHKCINIDLSQDDEVSDALLEYVGETFGYTRTYLLAKPQAQWMVHIHSIQLMERYLTNVWYRDHGMVD